MGALRRLFSLTARLSTKSKLKVILLSVLVAVSTTVFLAVSELSRVSSEGLDEAIARDVGQTGTYLIELNSGLGLNTGTLSRRLTEAVAPFAATSPIMIDVLPAVVPECPPFQQIGAQPVLVLRDAAGDPIRLPFGDDLPVDTELCFAGQVIPAEAIYLPDEAEQARWGSGLAVAVRYEHLVTLATTDPVTYRFTVTTGRRTDLQDAITRAVTSHLTDDARRYGVEIDDTVFVRRVDSGESIRDASVGIRKVYAFIGWGVLLLGGLGLLIAETIVVRDRMWFFGLARAVGAHSLQIALLVVIDVLQVVVIGTLLALGATVAFQPAVDQFAHDAFQVHVRLIRPSVAPALILGELVVLLLAATYPAMLAIRQDPLDVLEPRA